MAELLLSRAIFLGLAEAVGVRSAARLEKTPVFCQEDIDFPTSVVKYSPQCRRILYK
jgi:hypothetical protein